MGFLDNLFRRKAKPSAAPPDVQEAESDDEGEQTTFVSQNLSPTAQAHIKRLRDMAHGGASRYRWVLRGDACAACVSFAEAGPYEITSGLSKKAPVPGRETSCHCETTVETDD